MRKVLISIRPEWVCEILNKKKFIETRTTIPKCDLPCEVSIYCTKRKPYLLFNKVKDIYELSNDEDLSQYAKNGKVVAEFTLNKVDTYDYDIDFLNTNQKMYYIKSGELEKTCLTYEELCNYGKGKTLYGWHIDDLVIYDKSKELSEFGIKRAFQSWGYV